jgi:hypothetical protein
MRVRWPPMSPWLLSMMTMLSLAARGGVEVRSATSCPSSESVSTRLRPLLPDEIGGGDVAWVETAGPTREGSTTLRLRLVRQDGSVVADRRLSLQGGCDELADTVAAVVAAWETSPTSQDVAWTKPPGAVAPSRPTLQGWLGAGVGAALVGGLVPAANLELCLARAGSHGKARMAVTAQTGRTLGLYPGEVAWRRQHAWLGLGWQSLGASTGPFWRFSADAGMQLGWLTAEGRGFAPGKTQNTYEFGGGAGLRGERVSGPWSFWFEGRTSLWSKPQRARLSDASSEAELPRFDVFVTLGLSRLVLR